MSFRVVVAVVATGVVVGPLAGPSISVARKPPPVFGQDSVTGTVVTLGAGTVTLDASSGPSGENPTGRITLTDASGFRYFDGAVTCLNVQGSVALFKVPGGTPTNVPLSGRVTDNGASSTPDVLELDIRSLSNDCSSPEPAYGVPVGRVTSGDLTVVDAVAPPASRDACKRGGYAGFGFENQGQCVAFVARGPGS